MNSFIRVFASFETKAWKIPSTISKSESLLKVTSDATSSRKSNSRFSLFNTVFWHMVRNFDGYFRRLESVANNRTSLSTDLKNGISSARGKIRLPSSRFLRLDVMSDLSFINSSCRIVNSFSIIGFLWLDNSPRPFFPAKVSFLSFIIRWRAAPQ